MGLTELTELVWDKDTLVDKETNERVSAHHLVGPLPILYSKWGTKDTLMKELQEEVERHGLRDKVNAYVIGGSAFLPQWQVTAVDLYRID